MRVGSHHRQTRHSSGHRLIARSLPYLAAARLLLHTTLHRWHAGVCLSQPWAESPDTLSLDSWEHCSLRLKPPE